MANEFMEPEELGSQVGGEYDPMGTPINEKPYTKPNVKINPQDLQGDIPEPSFTPPVIDLGEPKLEVPPQPKKEREPFNKEMNDLPKRDKEVAASHVASMIMQLYEGANTWANKGMVFNEKRLNKLAQEGEVDFSLRIPVDYSSNQTVTLAEFVQDFNTQQKDALVVSRQFKEEVTPILERVLKKRGIGATDEQMLVFMFGKDIAIKGSMFFAARSQMSEIIGMMKEMTEQMKGGNYSSQVKNTQPTPPPPTPTPSEPIYDEPTILGEDEFEENFDEDENNEYDLDENEIVGTVSEQVEAQLQNKTVAQLRREELERARATYKPKPKGNKRGRKKKN
jgi:hypothetical protein